MAIFAITLVFSLYFPSNLQDLFVQMKLISACWLHITSRHAAACFLCGDVQLRPSLSSPNWFSLILSLCSRKGGIIKKTCTFKIKHTSLDHYGSLLFCVRAKRHLSAVTCKFFFCLWELNHKEDWSRRRPNVGTAPSDSHSLHSCLDFSIQSNPPGL